MEPQIILPQEEGEDSGINNKELKKSIERVAKSNMYEDLSTVIICPTRGMFPTRVVQSWMKMQNPLNQTVYGPIFAEHMKVDTAYNALIKYILGHEYLSKCKYILTIEEDNLPPVDGLLKLYESMNEYDAVSGLYWGKGDNGFPMIFGDPEKGPLDFAGQTPKQGEVQHCNALPMGFTLFKTEMFKNIEDPWFETLEGVSEKGIPQRMTQDIYFYRKAAKQGYKFAVDNRVLVGHFDAKNDRVW
jgi:hypothetical protein